ncbi:uracil-DNA glycosylase [Polluticoccus soli]|uniref:uracil-DNA glycosylase n=1 Tax=Polluticoccus soli TaxID=3034150 RepID=UPI0023E326CA|nr:uracil-DNA glycosylase [Flavipsychrobacter sp. JY13-12]
MDVKIEASWKDALQKEFSQPYFEKIVSFLKDAKQSGKVIYPAGSNIFNAFNTTPFEDVRVVILGQDPYHNPGQAHGLSFSVPKNVAPPPSLVNIFKEMSSDLGIDIPAHGNLEKWARQGVLLLNAALTVEANSPMSHSKIGWHEFTNDVIRTISDKKDHVVFILWGSFAKSKQELIDRNKHLILTAPHPSPLSAYNGFFGSGHFSKTNQWLQSKGLKPIDWSLDNN